MKERPTDEAVVGCQLKDEARVENSAKEFKMHNTTLQWILWGISMVVFLGLMLSGHTASLGLAITAVAVVWYTVVPKGHSSRQ